LASVEAKIDVDVGVQLTAEQRRERARKATLEAFAERTGRVWVCVCWCERGKGDLGLSAKRWRGHLG
jgi:hypothetical protein